MWRIRIYVIFTLFFFVHIDHFVGKWKYFWIFFFLRFELQKSKFFKGKSNLPMNRATKIGLIMYRRFMLFHSLGFVVCDLKKTLNWALNYTFSVFYLFFLVFLFFCLFWNFFCFSTLDRSQLLYFGTIFKFFTTQNIQYTTRRGE